MTTYQHGGDIQGFAKKAGCRIEDVIDLSSNINFVKPNIDVDFNTLDKGQTDGSAPTVYVV